MTLSDQVDYPASMVATQAAVRATKTQERRDRSAERIKRQRGRNLRGESLDRGESDEIYNSDSRLSTNEDESDPEFEPQSLARSCRVKLPSVIREVDRYCISKRAAAAIVNTTLNS